MREPEGMTELADRDACAGGWRMLCAGMLVQAVQRLESHAPSARVRYSTGSHGGYVKEAAYQAREAKRWIDGGVGAITFEDCCDALSVDSWRARQAIEAHCKKCCRKSRRQRH